MQYTSMFYTYADMVASINFVILEVWVGPTLILPKYK